MHKGYVCLFLHAHLPFVRHPEYDDFLEENWLFEAMSETYLPLLDVFGRLVNEKIPFRVTMSLTPTLCSMLRDPLLQERYLRYVEKRIELSEREIERTAYDKDFHGLALMYNRRFCEARNAFVNTYGRDLVGAFKSLQDAGGVEIVASCATHGFLPLLAVNPSSVRAQIRIGVDHYIKTFGRQPRGFWLPECGYYPGVDEELAEAGVTYFIVDTHGILNADPVSPYGVYAPVYCPSGVAAFGRDVESSTQVWSSKQGYPGDYDYREYYRDIGYELEYDYIKPYIHHQGIRINTGLKYWRITGPTEHKDPYVPDNAREKAALHAGNFMFNREKQIEYLAAHMDRRPIVVAPYDAELFGHWWYEGPQWIDFLIRKIIHDQTTIALITPSEYLAEYPVNPMTVPSASSWGFKGYCEYWLQGANDWLYRHLDAAGKRMAALAETFSSVLNARRPDDIVFRALNQAARELMLAQSSDWPFIMASGTTVRYATKRVTLHLGRFNRLYDDLMNNCIDEKWLYEVEYRDTIFSGMDCASYFRAEKRGASAAGKRVKRTQVSKKRGGTHARRH